MNVGINKLLVIGLAIIYNLGYKINNLKDLKDFFSLCIKHQHLGSKMEI
jgi:hypothetical protein